MEPFFDTSPTPETPPTPQFITRTFRDSKKLIRLKDLYMDPTQTAYVLNTINTILRFMQGKYAYQTKRNPTYTDLTRPAHTQFQHDLDPSEAQYTATILLPSPDVAYRIQAKSGLTGIETIDSKFTKLPIPQLGADHQVVLTDIPIDPERGMAPYLLITTLIEGKPIVVYAGSHVQHLKQIVEEDFKAKL